MVPIAAKGRWLFVRECVGIIKGSQKGHRITRKLPIPGPSQSNGPRKSRPWADSTALGISGNGFRDPKIGYL